VQIGKFGLTFVTTPENSGGAVGLLLAMLTD
jgi:hypothetical protein